MSSPASAIERSASQKTLAELIAASSIEMSPRELHRASDVAALLPKDTCVYIPSLPGLPLSRTLEAVAAIRAAGLDPVPHVSARRILDREDFELFLRKSVQQYGVHRAMLIGGDEPRAKGPYTDSLQILEEGVLAECGVREIGVAGYPEGHPRISNPALQEAKQARDSFAAHAPPVEWAYAVAEGQPAAAPVVAKLEVVTDAKPEGETPEPPKPTDDGGDGADQVVRIDRFRKK